MKKNLKKINDYILDDWGVDLIKVGKSIKDSVVTRILLDIFILLFACLTAIGWTGATFALLLSYPIFILLYLLGSLILLLFAYNPNYVFALLRRE